MANLGNILRKLNKLDEALLIQKECLETWRNILPKNHVFICISMNNLGLLLRDLNKLEDS